MLKCGLRGLKGKVKPVEPQVKYFTGEAYHKIKKQNVDIMIKANSETEAETKYYECINRHSQLRRITVLELEDMILCLPLENMMSEERFAELEEFGSTYLD